MHNFHTAAKVTATADFNDAGTYLIIITGVLKLATILPKS
jgi:hypothetical protein